MNDKSVTKIICRIITLLEYILIMFILMLISDTSMLVTDNSLFEKIFSSISIQVLICTIPLIIMMIISLVIKYMLKNDSKINPYRIVDVITRFVFTIPTTFIISYNIFLKLDFGVIINIIVGLGIFIILNLIVRFTLQETMEVTFIIHDNL